MPLYRIDQHLLFFVHIPKTGGTSIEQALEALGTVALRKKAKDTSAPAQHFHAEIYRTLVPAAFYDCGFTVCRNPYARLISEYRYQDSHEKTKGRGFDDWVTRAFSTYEKNPYVHHNHIRPQIEFLDPSVEVFRFENGLLPALSSALSRIGKPAPSALPHEKKFEKSPIFVKAATVKKIQAFYAEDFSALQYSMDPAQVFADQKVTVK